MQWTSESTKAATTVGLPTNGCPSQNRKNHVPVNRHPAEVKSTRMSKMGMRGSKRKAHQTLFQQCLERLLLDMPTGRDNPSSGLLEARSLISERASAHKRKPNEDAEQDTTSQSSWVVRGESTKGSLGDNLQNVYYKIQHEAHNVS